MGGGRGQGESDAEATYDGWSDGAFPVLRGVGPWGGPQSPVRIGRPIGSNGMGVVFEAVEVAHDRQRHDRLRREGTTTVDDRARTADQAHREAPVERRQPIDDTRGVFPPRLVLAKR